MFKKIGRQFGGAVLAAMLIQPLAPNALAAEPQAKIGETMYNELWQALEAVQDGQTIEILRDITNEELILSHQCNTAFSITIDLNGYTISESTSDSPGFTYLTADGSVAPTVILCNGTLNCTSKADAGSPFASGIWVESLDKGCRPVLILENMAVTSQNDAGINCIDAQLQVRSADIRGYDDAIYAQDAPVYIQAGSFFSISGTDKGKDGALAAKGSSAIQMTGYNAIIEPKDWQNTHSTQVEVTCFNDVPAGCWFYNTVYALANQKMVSGINHWAFEPDRDITRAEFIAMLARVSGEDISGYSSTYFSDIHAGDWYNACVGWAVQHGIASGYDAQTFGPNDTITREQVAVMLVNYENYTGKKGSADKTERPKFPDEDQISDWARDAMMAILDQGIIGGAEQSDGTILLIPKDNATRAQACVIIYNIMNLR